MTVRTLSCYNRSFLSFHSRDPLKLRSLYHRCFLVGIVSTLSPYWRCSSCHDSIFLS
nr:MAG TPA: YokU-like protein [Caudoviricetes sp.]DAR91974.1 MAG TPA: YokU-like protein [Bacteriophage sp.]